MDDVVELPRPFGPYLLLAQLARGGMGEVFLAKHGGLQGFEKVCVVKTLRPEFAAEDEYVARFSDEARVVIQLSHRNVCPVFDVGRAQGQLYVAMEHLIGRDLRMLIARGPVSIAVGVHVVAEVLEALDYAHRFIDPETEQPLGLVHRDVSPHNIILGVEGDVKLIDFGIATTSKSAPLNEGSMVLGKLGYMAPEHARGDVVDGRADQYAAAVLLVELITGMGFFDELSRDQAWRIAGKGGHRPAAFGSLDPALRAILDRALAAERDRRFASCAAFGDAVVAWARSLGHVADARDIRRLMTSSFPELPSQVRAVARAFSGQRAPAQDIVARTPGFETIATTMMMAPTTAGFSGAAPATTVVRERTLARGSTPSGAAAAAPLPRARRVLALGTAAAALAFAFAAGASVALRTGSDEEVIALPSSEVVAANVPPASHTAPMVPRDPPPPPPPLPPPPAAQPVAAPEPVSVEDRPRSAPRAGGKASARLSDDARRDLGYLSSVCTEKVSCAGPLLVWSRKKMSGADAAQIADSAKDCAKKCRLK